ncbi:MAG: DUF2357 domain-containing protein [Pirellulaceae bacterium]|nr:DUF2357 domain-containing protein [Pirellulaceae bacterium]
MTSSSFFSVWLRAGDRVLHQRHLDPLELPASEPLPLTIPAATKFAVEVRRVAADRRLRIVLGSEPVASVPARAAGFQTESQAWFWNELGDSAIRIERQLETFESRYELLWELPVRVVARTAVLRDYRVMMEDLQAIHQNLAHDVIGRGFQGYGLTSESVQALQPEQLVQSIQIVRDRLANCLAAIDRQPSTALVRRRVAVPYRGGERIDPASVQAVARDPLTVVDRQGRVRNLGRVQVRRPTITQDLPEHRQIAQAVRDLAKRAHLVGDHCRRAMELLEQQRHRWGRGGQAEDASVREQRDLPRIEQLEAAARSCPPLVDSLHQLISQYEFLAAAGPPRSPFGPTPTFLGRPEYRAIYDILLEARSPLGLLVDGDALRIAYRDLATLYEYWCFLQVVSYLRARFGAPRAAQAFSLIHDVYRPELTPGQQFAFQPDEQTQIVVRYTPEFMPLREARGAGLAWGASLTGEPLRPDITVELRRPSRPTTILVLDAKSTEQFSPRRLRELSDYSRQIVDIRTGYQPVRQVFLLHRGRELRPLVNLPGYFQGAALDRTSLVIGAVECAPQRVGLLPPSLGEVVDRFLEW